MHGEAAKLIKKVRAQPHLPAEGRRPAVADHVRRQDQRAGRSWRASGRTSRPAATARRSPERFTGTDKKWFTFTNGTHVDSLAPETFNRWYDFLTLYVAREAPMKNQAEIRAAAPLIYDAAMGVDGQTLPPDPIQEEPTYEGALAAFEAQEPIRILFDNGAGGDPGKPNPGFEQSFRELPGARHDRALVVPRERRRAPGRPAQRRGDRLVHVEPEGRAADRLHRGRHGRGRERPVDGVAGLQVGAAARAATASHT